MHFMQLHSRAPCLPSKSLHLLRAAWLKMKYKIDAFKQENNDSANNANRVFCIDFSLSQESLIGLISEIKKQ